MRNAMIGVGVLSRTDASPHSPFRYYPILNPGKWKVKKIADRVEFVHTLSDTASSYVYAKTVQLTKGKPELVLRHTLRNTGHSILETSLYDHNLFLLDQVENNDRSAYQCPLYHYLGAFQ
jgi:hypothetical protein